MRTLCFLIALFFFAVASRAADGPRDSFKSLPEFGAKDEKTITVKISGEGFEKPGMYHLPRGTLLLALVEQAGVSKIASRRFVVSREVDGYERTFGFRMSRAKEPPLPDFLLADGDLVYAAINLP